MNRAERRAKAARERKSSAWKALERVVEQHGKPIAEREDMVPRSPCGHCGKALDGASHEDGIKPKPGDLSVCWACAGINRFGPTLALERLDEADFPPEVADELRHRQSLIRAAMMGSVGRTRGDA